MLLKRSRSTTDHAKFASRQSGVDQRFRHVPIERRAVRQIGQRVMIGEVRNSRFGGLPLRSVLDHTQKIAWQIVGVVYDHAVRRDMSQSVFDVMNRRFVENHFAAGFDQSPVTLEDDVCGLFGEKIVHQFSQNICARNTEKLLTGTIDQYVAQIRGRP